MQYIICIIIIIITNIEKSGAASYLHIIVDSL